MKLSRRETMQLSATALAAWSLAKLNAAQAAGQPAPAQPDSLVNRPLRNIAELPLRPDGSAVEYPPEQAGAIEGVLWKTASTPDIEFDYRKLKISLDARGTATLAGT